MKNQPKASAPAVGAQHTPGPWRSYHSERNGQSGNKHADLFLIESNTRKSMAILEVWSLNSDKKWRKANPQAIKEHAETLKEVEANAHLIAAAPDLLAKLESAVADMAWAVDVVTAASDTKSERKIVWKDVTLQIYAGMNRISEYRAAIAKAKGQP